MYKFLLISGHCKDISADVGPAWSFCFAEYTKISLEKFEYYKIPKYIFLLKNIHFKRSFYFHFVFLLVTLEEAAGKYGI